MTKAEIDRFVESKREWVERMTAKSAIQAEQKAAFTVDYGSRLPYRGREYIVGGHETRTVLFDNAFCVPVYLNPDQVKRACIQIYRLLAKRDLVEKVGHFAAKMDVVPSGIKINGAKT
ncbi:MAG: M48 family metallopeptidase, partial [Oscillospiraceae bacterium]|nr:M48 family metallopeptidase [Oscillospiraceae bacterium]